MRPESSAGYGDGPHFVTASRRQVGDDERRRRSVLPEHKCLDALRSEIVHPNDPESGVAESVLGRIVAPCQVNLSSINYDNRQTPTIKSAIG